MIIQDKNGREISRKVEVKKSSAPSWELLTRTVLTYDDNRGQLKTTTKDGRVIQSAVFDKGRKTSEDDEDGVRTTFTYDNLDRIATTLRDGVTTTYTRDVPVATGFKDTVAISEPSMTTLTSFTIRDAAGRLVQDSSQQGLVTGITYTPATTTSGPVTTTVRPDTGTEVRTLFRDGQLNSITGTGVVHRAFTYTPAAGQVTAQVTEGSGGNRYITSTVRDQAGRIKKSSAPGDSVNVDTLTWFNGDGQVSIVEQKVGASQFDFPVLFEYGNLGQLTKRGQDVNGDGAPLEITDDDVIAEFENDFEKVGSIWYQRSATHGYLNDSNTKVLLSESLTRMNFDSTVHTHGLLASESTVVSGTGASQITSVYINLAMNKRTVVTDSGGSDLLGVDVYTKGLLTSSSSTALEDPIDYGYDNFNRLLTIKDPRTQSQETRRYNSVGQVDQTRIVNGSDQIMLTDLVYYPTGEAGAGQVKEVTDTFDGAATAKTFLKYDLLGNLTHRWGDRGYPVRYAFDERSRLSSLFTYRGGDNWDEPSFDDYVDEDENPVEGVGDDFNDDVLYAETTWTYRPDSNLLWKKTDDTGNFTEFVYQTDGKLSTRKWSRTQSANNVRSVYTQVTGSTRLSTIVHYSNGGSTSTETITFSAYDHSGNVRTVVDSAGTHTLTYHADGSLASDSIGPGGGNILANSSVSTSLDGNGRRTTLTGNVTGTTIANVNYSYAGNGLLHAVEEGNAKVVLGRVPKSTLVGSKLFTYSGEEMAASRKLFDEYNRAKVVSTRAWGSGPAGSVVAGRSYEYDSRSRRTKVHLPDGRYWDYGYNVRDEVTSAAKKWPDTTHQAGRKFTYSYDNIGNRISAARGGDGNGANLRTTNYSAAGGSGASTNDKNQYVTIKNHRYYDIVGTDPTPGSVGVTVSGATVTNGDQASFNYFRREVSHTGTTTGHFDTVTVTPSVGSGQSGNRYLPMQTEAVAHDNDGNRTTDSRWVYTWMRTTDSPV